MRKDFQHITSEVAAHSSGWKDRSWKVRLNNNDTFGDIDEEFLENAPQYSRTRATKQYVGMDGYPTTRQHNIHRMLLANVGRLWDDVYSEFREIFGQKMQLHSRRNWNVIGISSYVHLDVWFGDDGKVYSTDTSYNTYGTPINSSTRNFYIHPTERTLEALEPSITKKSLKQQCVESKNNPNRVIASPKLQFHKIDGNWFTIVTRPLPPKIKVGRNKVVCPWIPIEDVLVKSVSSTRIYSDFSEIGVMRMVRYDLLIAKYGAEVYGVKKTSTSRRDIAKYNLRQHN